MTRHSRLGRGKEKQTQLGQNPQCRGRKINQPYKEKKYDASRRHKRWRNHHDRVHDRVGNIKVSSAIHVHAVCATEFIGGAGNYRLATADQAPRCPGGGDEKGFPGRREARSRPPNSKSRTVCQISNFRACTGKVKYRTGATARPAFDLTRTD
jgi:hypothetical protein